jgi:5-methylcytosine-specific restriction enzyme subunit McrC
LLLRDGSLDLYPEALPGDLFQVRLDHGRMKVKAQGLVGWIALNDRLGLDVSARVQIGDLDRILVKSGVAPKEFLALARTYDTSQVVLPSLRETIARAFLAAIEPIQTGGLYRPYVQRRDDTSFPKGRILPGETQRMHWPHGRRDRVRVSWFDKTLDVGPNQVLKLAIEALAELYQAASVTKGVRETSARLNAAHRLFDGVTATRAGLADPDVADTSRLPAVRDYYRPAIELAKMILAGQSVRIDRPGTTLELPSLLFSLDTAFEDYLRVVLAEQLRDLAPDVLVLDGNIKAPAGAGKGLFDGRASPPASPDIGLRSARHADRWLVMVEVKYFDHGFGRDEFEQAIAYAASYRSPIVLVRPRNRSDTQMGLATIGQINSVELFSYVFDLGQSALDVVERRFAVDLWRRFLSGGPSV